MKPGRELDDLIIERVFNLHSKRFGSGGGEWLDENEKSIFGFFNQPQYSTSIEAAWLVVEKVGEGGFYLHCDIGGWFARWERYDKSKIKNCDTPSLAICLAALKVVEK